MTELALEHDDTGSHCSPGRLPRNKQRSGLFRLIEGFQRSHDLTSWLDYLPLVLSFLVYSPNLAIEAGEDGFIYDDPSAILKNPCVMGSGPDGNESLSCLLFVDYWGTPLVDNSSHKSYRPVTSATFRLDNYMWTTKVSRLWHLGNVICHAICSFLVVKVAKRCFGGVDGEQQRHLEVGAIMAGCLFAVHSVHTDCISNLAGRAEPLAAMFSMLAFLVYAREPFTVCRLSVAVLLAVCATLSKEAGMTVLGVIAVFLICNEIERIKFAGTKREIFISCPCAWPLRLWSNVRRQCKVHLALIALCTGTLLYVRLRIQVRQPVFSPFNNRAAFTDVWLTRYLSFAYYAARHVGLLLMPFRLCPDWSITTVPLVTSLKSEEIIWIAVLLLGSAIFLYHVAQRVCDVDENATPLVMSLAWLVLPFIPASNMFFVVGFTLAERVLYSPSIGLCLLVGYGAAIIWKKLEASGVGSKKIWHVVMLLVVTLHGIRTILRDAEWNTKFTLWERSSSACYDSPICLANHAVHLHEVGKHQQSIPYFENALKRMSPLTMRTTVLQLAGTYADVGKHRDKLLLCRDKLNGHDGMKHKCVGEAAEQLGLYNMAALAFTEALAYPTEAYFNSDMDSPFDKSSANEEETPHPAHVHRLGCAIGALHNFNLVGNHKEVVRIGSMVMKKEKLPKSLRSPFFRELAVAHRNLGEIHTAYDFINQSIEESLEEDIFTLITHYDILRDVGKDKMAESVLGRLSVKWPRHAQTLRRVAKTKKDITEKLETYKEALLGIVRSKREEEINTNTTVKDFINQLDTLSSFITEDKELMSDKRGPIDTLNLIKDIIMDLGDGNSRLVNHSEDSDTTMIG